MHGGVRPGTAEVNRNGCSTRDDILARDLTGVGKRSSCVVTSGTLHDPYTGATITFRKADAAAVQIDHDRGDAGGYQGQSRDATAP